MLHISEFHVQKYADKGGFPLSLKFYIVYALVFDWLYVCKFKIKNERYVINVKVERKHRRTGLRFGGVSFSFLYASSRAFVLHDVFPAN